MKNFILNMTYNPLNFFYRIGSQRQLEETAVRELWLARACSRHWHLGQQSVPLEVLHSIYILLRSPGLPSVSGGTSQVHCFPGERSLCSKIGN